MRKILTMSVAGLTLLGLASCSNEDMPRPYGEGDGNVVFHLNLPEDMTRTFSDGLKAKQLKWAIYEHNQTTPIMTVEDADAFTGLTATVRLQLVNSKQYDIVFWADTPDETPYTFDAATQSVSIDYAEAAAKGVNNEEADAFYGNLTLTVNGPVEQTVTLRRPLAQINLGTTDWNTSVVESADLSLQTTLSTQAYQTLNLLSGEVSDQVDVKFAKGPLPDDTEVFPIADRDDIKYLLMNYILVDENHAIQDATFEIYNGTAYRPMTTVDVPNMPVQRNYRTNIFGSLLTTQTTVTVTIDPMYYGNFEVEIPRWDGKSIAIDPDADGNYHITLPGHLAYIAEIVNGGNSLANTNVYLDNDIDLYNHEWTPIGTTSSSFKGNFDGGNHRILNLSCHQDIPYSGLFGQTQNGTIKNLTVENVHIVNNTTEANSGTGAIAGVPYTTTYTGITLTGEIQVSAFRYVGAMFGHNMYSRSSDLTVDIPEHDKPYSWVKATAAVGFYPNHCGGIVGYMGEGNSQLTNATSNIDVISYAPGVGGVIGTAQNSNTYTNCSSSGNVTLYTSGSTYAFVIGGIAGEYVGSGITFDNCSFTGTLTSYNGTSPVTLDANNTICGIAYTGGFSRYSKNWNGISIVND